MRNPVARGYIPAHSKTSKKRLAIFRPTNGVNLKNPRERSWPARAGLILFLDLYRCADFHILEEMLRHKSRHAHAPVRSAMPRQLARMHARALVESHKKWHLSLL